MKTKRALTTQQYVIAAVIIVIVLVAGYVALRPQPEPEPNRWPEVTSTSSYLLASSQDRYSFSASRVRPYRAGRSSIPTPGPIQSACISTLKFHPKPQFVKDFSGITTLPASQSLRPAISVPTQNSSRVTSYAAFRCWAMWTKGS